MPAVAAGPSSTTPRTSSPSRSSSPTDLRSRAATCGGASATPRRTRSNERPSAIAVDRVAQGGVDGAGEVEAVLEAVGVDADDAPGPIQHRRP